MRACILKAEDRYIGGPGSEWGSDTHTLHCIRPTANAIRQYTNRSRNWKPKTETQRQGRSMLLISIMLICIRDRSYDEWHLILFCVKLRGCSWRGDLPFDPMIVRPFFYSGPHLSRWVLDSWYFGGATSQAQTQGHTYCCYTGSICICIWIGIWSWSWIWIWTWVWVRIPDTVRNVSVSALSWFGTRVPLHALVASVNKSWQLSVWPLKSGEGEIGSHLHVFSFFSPFWLDSFFWLMAQSRDHTRQLPRNLGRTCCQRLKGFFSADLFFCAGSYADDRSQDHRDLDPFGRQLGTCVIGR